MLVFVVVVLQSRLHKRLGIYYQFSKKKKKVNNNDNTTSVDAGNIGFQEGYSGC